MVDFYKKDKPTPLEDLLRMYFLKNGSGGRSVIKTVKAALVHITDALAKPLLKCEVTLEPIQDLHGQDAPYPAGGGKNLIQPFLAESESTSYGLTLTLNSDGSIRVHGTSTVASATLLSMMTVSIPVSAGTYTFNIGITDSNNNIYCQIVNSSGHTYFSRYAKDTYTASSDFTITRLDIGCNPSNGEAIDVTIYPQLESGSTASAWSPYENICPITGHTGANVYRSGADTSDPTTIPITFPDAAGTVYGGTMDLVSGKLVVDSASVDISALDWTPSSATSHVFRSDSLKTMIKPSTSPQKLANALCSSFWQKAYGPISQSDNGAFAIANIGQGAVTGRLVFIDHRYSTNSGFAEGNSGVQLVYELATPIEYDLTPQQITALLGENNIWADTGSDVEVVYKASAS